MNITVTDQENCKKQLHLEIPGETVRAETDKVAGNLARQMNVPGFRPGHAPKSVIKTRFRKELRDEVVSHLLPESLQKAITEKDLKVIGEPAIDELKFGDDESISVTITISVKPEFELADYKGMPLTKRVYKIRDEDVEKELDRLRDLQAELVPVEDRDAQPGDTVTVTLTGQFEAPAPTPEQAEGEPPQPSSEEPPAEEAKAETEEKAQSEPTEAVAEAPPQVAAEDEAIKQEDVDINIGGDGVLKEFTEALTGAKPGDERRFSVEYPAEYKPERFAGRKLNYTASVTAVRIKELPEANDEFAQSVDEAFKTIDDLRADIRKQLEHQGEHHTEEGLRALALDTLVDSNQFAVPDFILDRQITSRFNALLNQLFSSGIDPRQMQIDWTNIREGQRERAERDVRGLFILDRIAEQENIEITEEDVNDELEEYALSRGETVAAAKARLTKEEALDSIKEQVRQQKALDLVITSAELKTEEVEGLRTEDAATGEPEAAAAGAEASEPEKPASDADAGSENQVETTGE